MRQSKSVTFNPSTQTAAPPLTLHLHCLQQLGNLSRAAPCSGAGGRLQRQWQRRGYADILRLTIFS